MAWRDVFRKQTPPVLAAPGAAVQGPVAQGTSIEVINGGTATPLDRTAMAMLQEYNRALYLWRCVDMIGQMSASVVLEVAPLQTRPVNEAEAQVQRLLLRPNPQWDA